MQVGERTNYSRILDNYSNVSPNSMVVCTFNIGSISIKQCRNECRCSGVTLSWLRSVSIPRGTDCCHDSMNSL